MQHENIETVKNNYQVAATAIKDKSMLGSHGEKLCKNIDVHWMTPACTAADSDKRKCNSQFLSSSHISSPSPITAEAGRQRYRNMSYRLHCGVPNRSHVLVRITKEVCMAYGFSDDTTQTTSCLVSTVRRCALHRLCDRNSVCLSVRLSVCHTRALRPHGSTYDHDFSTIW